MLLLGLHLLRPLPPRLLLKESAHQLVEFDLCCSVLSGLNVCNDSFLLLLVGICGPYFDITCPKNLYAHSLCWRELDEVIRCFAETTLLQSGCYKLPYDISSLRVTIFAEERQILGYPRSVKHQSGAKVRMLL